MSENGDLARLRVTEPGPAPATGAESDVLGAGEGDDLVGQPTHCAGLLGDHAAGIWREPV